MKKIPLKSKVKWTTAHGMECSGIVLESDVEGLGALVIMDTLPGEHRPLVVCDSGKLKVTEAPKDEDDDEETAPPPEDPAEDPEKEPDPGSMELRKDPPPTEA